jgi:mRNA interferase RelE/StbE
MPWKITWTSEALIELARLDNPVAQRVVAKLEGATANPPRLFSRLKGSYLWRLRVGDYRVIAKLHHEFETVEIRKVGHRSTVYGR